MEDYIVWIGEDLQSALAKKRGEPGEAHCAICGVDAAVYAARAWKGPLEGRHETLYAIVQHPYGGCSEYELSGYLLWEWCGRKVE
jgi:hypothetical protein